QRERPPSSVVAPISELPVRRASSATFPSSKGLKLVSRSYFSKILRSAATTNGANRASIPVEVGTFLKAALPVVGTANTQMPAPQPRLKKRRGMLFGLLLGVMGVCLPGRIGPTSFAGVLAGRPGLSMQFACHGLPRPNVSELSPLLIREQSRAATGGTHTLCHKRTCTAGISP